MACGPTAAELAQIQSDVVAFLDLDCTIQRKTLTQDAFGSATEVWNTIASVKAGMKQPSASLLQNYASRIGSLATWQIRFASGVDVQEQDRLIIPGTTMTVQASLTPQSYSVYVNVLASEVK